MIKYIFFFFLSCKMFAQYPILNDTIKQPGVYKTFSEFRNNKPSIKLEYQILTKIETIQNGIWGKEGINLYALNIPKDISEGIGEVFGFCDGTNFYIVSGNGFFSDNELHEFAFYKIQCLAKYPYLDIILLHNSPIPSSSGGFGVSYNTIDLAIVYFETGEIQRLTKARLKKILSDQPQLLEKFNKQENKNDYLKQYLIEYLKK